MTRAGGEGKPLKSLGRLINRYEAGEVFVAEKFGAVGDGSHWNWQRANHAISELCGKSPLQAGQSASMINSWARVNGRDPPIRENHSARVRIADGDAPCDRELYLEAEAEDRM